MDPQVSLPVVGIDVSRASLVLCYQGERRVHHLEVSSTKAGFEQLLQASGANCLFVTKATGAYYLLLAYSLHAQSAQVVVLNPLVIKRFIQMHLGKSNCKDAQWL